MVKAHVQLDCALGGPECCPGENREAQVNGRGIQGIEFVFKTKAVFRCLSLTTGEQFMKEGFV
jgi:hypothetical protein